MGDFKGATLVAVLHEIVAMVSTCMRGRMRLVIDCDLLEAASGVPTRGLFSSQGLFEHLEVLTLSKSSGVLIACREPASHLARRCGRV